MARGPRDVPDVAADAPVDGRGRRISLNRSERIYLALDGIAGSVAQTHVLRFATAHTTATLRATIRSLVRTTPRLRTQIVRGFAGWFLRVRADDQAIDQAFAAAFRERPIGDFDDELAALTNQTFDLARDLPLRVRVFVGDGTPTVIFNLHHIVGDGRAMIELIAAFMALLNGGVPAPLFLDDPSLLPALVPVRRGVRTVLTNLWRSFWLHRRTKRTRRHLRSMSLQQPGPFTRTAVRLYESKSRLRDLKLLGSTCGASITDLVVAAFAHAFAAHEPREVGKVVTARLSLDLRQLFPPDRRPRFGNYVASFVIDLPGGDDFTTLLGQAHAQVRDWIMRFADQLLSYPLLVAALTPRLLGRKLLGRAALALKQRGRLEPITFHLSNLGNVDALNSFGPHARLSHLHFFTPAVGPYIGCVGLEDRLFIALTYATDELNDSQVDALLAHVDSTLAVAAPQAKTA
jgi:NRPS condensation-like uncharacterized protein